jgi:DNA repair protein RadC
MARELLVRYGGFRGLFSQDAAELQRVQGLGPAKAALLLAVTEIARRQLKEEILGKNFVHDPQSVLDYLYSCLRDRQRELFKVLFLNKANRIIAEKDLFEGTVDETAVHPREVVKAGLAYQATSLILVHNHPSGRIHPSQEDREITKRLEQACGSVSIKILDHIIIGDNQYFSFREHHLLS